MTVTLSHFVLGKGEKPAYLERDDDDFPVSAERETQPRQQRSEKPIRKSKRRLMKVCD